MDFRNSQKVLEDLFLRGLKACSPQGAVAEYIEFSGDNIAIDGEVISCNEHPIYVWATGKAAVPMYEQVVKILDDEICKSLVITNDSDQASCCEADEVIVGGHPVPDANSLKAGKRTVTYYKEIPEHAIVLCLISGGASSLLTLPAEGIVIDELSKLFELLNNSGATIEEINTVRKHCSQIKGGQLLRHLDPTVTLFDLAISDVPNDKLSIIGSGPTIPDTSTYQEANDILLKYNLLDKVAESITVHIQKGRAGEALETIKPDQDPITNHYSTVISSGWKLIQSIGALAKEQGIAVRLFNKPFNADVEVVALSLVDKVWKEKVEEPMLYLFYGESTVQVTKSGKGGRNQELALRGAVEIEGHENISWLSAGTDGIDGPTDAAGAIVDGGTIAKAQKMGVEPWKYLKNNDSYHFHKKMGTLLKTGPTGNNLMDVVLVLDSDKI